MVISENKMQIVIDNYFKSECDINTSIRSAFEKGFRIGVKKASSAQPEIVHCKDCKWKQGAECVRFAEIRVFPDDFCSRAEKREDG